jgi:hypothetical protein
MDEAPSRRGDYLGQSLSPGCVGDGMRPLACGQGGIMSQLTVQIFKKKLCFAKLFIILAAGIRASE